MRVLLIEDDAMLGRALVQALRDGGASVDWVSDAAAASEALRDGGHAVALLDLGLPGGDGIDLLREARRGGIATPILVVTARDDLATRLQGLDLGADDVVLKPFDPAELLARIRAVLRRRSGHATSRIGTGDLWLDLATRELGRDGSTGALSPREFALMRALLERPGTILSRGQLEERIYGWGEEVESNAVEVLIHAVRKRFGRDVIRNVRGAGWMVSKA